MFISKLDLYLPDKSLAVDIVTSFSEIDQDEVREKSVTAKPIHKSEIQKIVEMQTKRKLSRLQQSGMLHLSIVHKEITLKINRVNRDLGKVEINCKPAKRNSTGKDAPLTMLHI